MWIYIITLISKTHATIAKYDSYMYNRFTLLQNINNIGKLRCSTAEIGSHYDHVLACQLFFVKWMRSTYHHLRSETRQTGNSMGVTIRLESALDLVKQMERGKERNWRKPRDESIMQKFRKPSRQVLYEFIFYQIRWLTKPVEFGKASFALLYVDGQNFENGAFWKRWRPCPTFFQTQFQNY